VSEPDPLQFSLSQDLAILRALCLAFQLCLFFIVFAARKKTLVSGEDQESTYKHEQKDAY
jgi:hypothetical protein